MPILYIDFSNFGKDFIALSKEVSAVLSVFEQQPVESVLCLADFRDTDVSRGVTALIKGSAPQIGPHVRKAAIIIEEASGFKSLIVTALARVGGRGAILFDDVEQARDWLVGDE
jgi:hypothetical protein